VTDRARGDALTQGMRASGAGECEAVDFFLDWVRVGIMLMHLYG
jgi:hypothetical protein